MIIKQIRLKDRIVIVKSCNGDQRCPASHDYLINGLSCGFGCSEDTEDPIHYRDCPLEDYDPDIGQQDCRDCIDCEDCEVEE